MRKVFFIGASVAAALAGGLNKEVKECLKDKKAEQCDKYNDNLKGFANRRILLVDLDDEK